MIGLFNPLSSSPTDSGFFVLYYFVYLNMAKEEILNIQQLREVIFENRTNAISLKGIVEYFRRNNQHYTLEETFEVNAMCLGALQLYHEDNTVLQ